MAALSQLRTGVELSISIPNFANFARLYTSNKIFRTQARWMLAVIVRLGRLAYLQLAASGAVPSAVVPSCGVSSVSRRAAFSVGNAMAGPVPRIHEDC